MMTKEKKFGSNHAEFLVFQQNVVARQNSNAQQVYQNFLHYVN